MTATLLSPSESATPEIEDFGGILVVRDDRTLGGTKARILPDYLPPADEYVYASPAYGYAQIALAVACRKIGGQATIFTAKRSKPHARTAAAARYGAKVVMVPTGYLSNVQAKARDYCRSTGAMLCPFGFDDDAFVEGIARLAMRLDACPSRVWCVAGSGVLSRGLAKAWPNAELLVVQVGKSPRVVPRATVITAPERFEEDARISPPFQSCSNYDAKAWRFIVEQGRPGDLFWNVAG